MQGVLGLLDMCRDHFTACLTTCEKQHRHQGRTRVEAYNRELDMCRDHRCLTTFKNNTDYQLVGWRSA